VINDRNIGRRAGGLVYSLRTGLGDGDDMPIGVIFKISLKPSSHNVDGVRNQDADHGILAP
jgi:hypothetical protein